MNIAQKIFLALAISLLVIPAALAAPDSITITFENAATEISEPSGKSIPIYVTTISKTNQSESYSILFTLKDNVTKKTITKLNTETFTGGLSPNDQGGIQVLSTSGLAEGNYILQATSGGKDSNVLQLKITPKKADPKPQANKAPYFVVNNPQPENSIGNNPVYVKPLNKALEANLTAIDPDKDKLSVNVLLQNSQADYVAGLPPGVTHKVTGNNIQFTGTPTKEGKWGVTVQADDGKDKGTKEVLFNITFTNTKPTVTIDTSGANATKVREGHTKNFQLKVTDPDNQKITYEGELYTDNFLCKNFDICDSLPQDETSLSTNGVFSYTPKYDTVIHPKLTENVSFRFRAKDGITTSTWTYLNLTVVDVDRETNITTQSLPDAVEGTAYKFEIKATDSDSEDLPLTISTLGGGLPKGMSVVNNELTGTPEFTEGGKTYPITFVAINKFKKQVSKTLTLTVKETNQAPKFTQISLTKDKIETSFTAEETNNIEFNFNAIDPDGDNVIYALKGKDEAKLKQYFDNTTKTFRWTTQKGDEGIYQVDLIASDGSLADTKSITITVTKKKVQNQAPSLTVPAKITKNEGELVSFTATATDPENDPLTYSLGWLGTIPKNANLNPTTGEFTWQTDFTNAGTYVAVISVEDDKKASTSKNVQIEILDVKVNQSPTLTVQAEEDFAEGATKTITWKAVDDQPGVKISYKEFNSNTELANAQFRDNNDGTATFSWKPSFTAAENGPYFVTVIAIDSEGKTDSKQVKFNVANNNQPPVFKNLTDKTVKEGETLSFKVEATDPDGDDNRITYTITKWADNRNTPSDVSFKDGQFTWTPGFDQAGSHSVEFTAQDSEGTTTAKTITITVSNSNTGPTLDPVGNKMVAEGTNLTFKVTAKDKEGDNLIFKALGKLAQFFDPITQIFNWTPDFTQAGSHEVEFMVTEEIDGVEGLRDSEKITIDVTDVNQAPYITTGDQFGLENQLLTFTVEGEDIDNDPFTIALDSVLPAGASFNNGIFTWTPTFDQAGVYEVTFVIDDSKTQRVAKVIKITIDNVNRGPVITSTPPAKALADKLYTYQVTAVDPDNDPLTYSATITPADKAFIDPQTGLFEWYPSLTGDVTITIFVTDGELTASQTFTVSSERESRGIKISKVHLGPEFIYPGEYLTVHTDFQNNGNVDLKDLETTVMIYDLGVYRSSGQVTLREGESHSRNLQVQLPYDIPQGVYMVRVHVGNSQFHETAYRQIRVI